eukprot:Rhum_TRINITY_DN9440_c0_g1::Rhum_TRINITY_DN9440_c0_g1_i1::g.33529::m.33529
MGWGGRVRRVESRGQLRLLTLLHTHSSSQERKSVVVGSVRRTPPTESVVPLVGVRCGLIRLRPCPGLSGAVCKLCSRGLHFVAVLLCTQRACPVVEAGGLAVPEVAVRVHLADDVQHERLLVALKPALAEALEDARDPQVVVRAAVEVRILLDEVLFAGAVHAACDAARGGVCEAHAVEVQQHLVAAHEAGTARLVARDELPLKCLQLLRPRVQTHLPDGEEPLDERVVGLEPVMVTKPSAHAHVLVHVVDKHPPRVGPALVLVELHVLRQRRVVLLAGVPVAVRGGVGLGACHRVVGVPRGAPRVPFLLLLRRPLVRPLLRRPAAAALLLCCGRLRRRRRRRRNQAFVRCSGGRQGWRRGMARRRKGDRRCSRSRCGARSDLGSRRCRCVHVRFGGVRGGRGSHRRSSCIRLLRLGGGGDVGSVGYRLG